MDKYVMYSIGIAIFLIGCTELPSEEVRTKVALVTDVGSVDDQTFNQYAFEGLERARSEFNLQIDYKEAELEVDENGEEVANYLENINIFADLGYELIITVGFAMGDDTKEAALSHPDTKFAVIDSYPTNDDGSAIENLQGILFKEQEVGYIAGVLAGKFVIENNQDRVGFLGGVAIPPVKKFGNGFYKGVKSVCADCKYSCQYVFDFANISAGETAAQEIIAEGAYVLFGAGGLTGSSGIKKAASLGSYVIGVDQDEFYTTFNSGAVTGAELLLTSATKDVAVGVVNTVKTFVEGNFTGEAVTYGFQDEGLGSGVALAPYHAALESLSEDIKASVIEVEEGLRGGTIDTGVDGSSGDIVNPTTGEGDESLNPSECTNIYPS
ncbi:BMP family ABC transporter substrate-binding protein [Pseudobacteriovorax antillogorgiicola]|uniref:Nucleoside-binding protein n=1 Tax=Pseudobacteriovorax antillogorgiicola TaxID=1513793 RepID=A0A1Y6CV62_9BACT|nr:BMP family ABC transporter substrate-binding protein [Pseudobacteriovorax antillogorgiicola]TCS51632.1 nucleoside-binding protein [Pseudobacteriovorax antillogorgiicola]SMF81573.1 nucleoside-binding protein [Pseudobacteriovorax antillogorgiicola]